MVEDPGGGSWSKEKSLHPVNTFVGLEDGLLGGVGM